MKEEDLTWEFPEDDEKWNAATKADPSSPPHRSGKNTSFFVVASVACFMAGSQHALTPQFPAIDSDQSSEVIQGLGERNTQDVWLIELQQTRYPRIMVGNQGNHGQSDMYFLDAKEEP